MHKAFIALGGNLGEVRQTFAQACNELNRSDKIELLNISKLYQTTAIGPAGQPDYLNAVIAIQTSLTPESLLQRLQSIEDAHGRIREERWGARTLDLDIIAFCDLAICEQSGDLQMQTDKLTIPHPMMHKRLFVLCPLCDIAPTWQHPLLKLTAQQMMERLITDGERPLHGEVWQI